MRCLWENDGLVSLTVSTLFRKEKAGRKGVCRASPAVTMKPIAEVPLALTPLTSGIRQRQACGFVYFIGPEALLHRKDALVKIGFTRNNPLARLNALQIGSPLPLRLWAYTPGSEALEKAFHATFAELRSHGEWFFALHKLYDFLGYLGEEPNIGQLISPEQLEIAVFDNVFSMVVPHPSVPEYEWLRSAEPRHLAPFFPDLWHEACAWAEDHP